MGLIKWGFKIFVLAIFIGLAIGGFLVFDYQRFLNTPVVGEKSPQVYHIQSGDTMSALIRYFPEKSMFLAEKSPFSLLLGKYYFRYLAKSTQRGHRLKVGDYQLTQGMTADALLELFTSGRTITYEARFVEGRTFSQLRTVLTKNTAIEQTLTLVPDAAVLSVLGVTEFKHPEGLFFPDTYHFPNRTKDVDVLKQSYQLMQKNLAKAWQSRDPSIALKTPYELLILASIIEKETAVKGERDKISGVFHRRLAKGMPLQTDPTVIYGLGHSYRGTLYKSDLKKDTPYNTYTRKGLPPTPIAMPGMASLMAAGQPDKGKSLYFVADGNGGHTFSDTYSQHLQAVKKYRQRQKN